MKRLRRPTLDSCISAPNPNGLSWALLVGYRLLGSEVGRYQQNLAAPNDVPFPSPISSLGGLWNTRFPSPPLLTIRGQCPKSIVGSPASYSDQQQFSGKSTFTYEEVAF